MNLDHNDASSSNKIDNGSKLNLYEFNTHSFIIKIWLERESQPEEPAVWRGYIIHILSGKQHPLLRLDDITQFFLDYLEQMGVQSDIW